MSPTARAPRAWRARRRPSLACSDLNTPIYFNGPTPLLELQGTEMIPRITNSVTLQFRAAQR